jgi:hypothetical protein
MPKFAIFNANGLAGKADAILKFSEELDIDIFFVLETWLIPDKSPLIQRPFINITKPHRVVGQGRPSGGILGFCKHEYQAHIRPIEIDEEKNYVVLRILDLVVAVGYFSPGIDNNCIPTFIDKVAELSNNWEEPTILMGDFNARHRAFQDTTTTGRGTILHGQILEHHLEVQEPIQGKFTSYKEGGRGIPDLLITNGTRPREFIVHEGESLGGSDHRPLTFIFESEVPAEIPIDRWDVRKLAKKEVRERYRDRMVELAVTYEHHLEQAFEDIIATATNGQEEIDRMWKIFLQWIDEAAEETCGRVKRDPFAKKSFWTDELLDMKATATELTERHQTMIATNQPAVITHAAAAELTAHNQRYREAMTRRRTELFDEIVNDLGTPQNSAAFLKMVKSTQSRRNRAGCKLDPEKVNEHATYYRETFGGEPMGNQAEYAVIEEFPPPELSEDLQFTEFSVGLQLKHLPLGKAPGTDGVMAEFLVYAKTAIIEPLTKFLNICSKYIQIPTCWKQALIVPFFKNKGSDLEIKNYRTIALTCIGRRLYERLLCT